MKHFKLYLLVAIIVAASQISIANAETVIMHREPTVITHLTRPPSHVNFVPPGNATGSFRTENSGLSRSSEAIILNIIEATKIVLHTLHKLLHLFSHQ